MTYRRRILDDELDELMADLAAIAIEGPKGVGKTETGLQRAQTILRLDEPSSAALALADPAGALDRPRPILLDEWQRAPQLWDSVRRAVDGGAAPGSFLLAGSATPVAGADIHSGAGRIVTLRMRPMSLVERQLATPTVSLAELFGGTTPKVGGECALRLRDYAREIEASGFPGLRDLSDRARRAQLDAYLRRVAERDLTDEQGVTLRRPDSLMAWLSAYAAATATVASWEAIRAAASPGDADPPSKTTTIRYRDWLTSLWLLDPVPAWLPLGSPLKGLTRGPKHHLADPALAARLLGVGASALLDGEGRVVPVGGTALGALFEALATLTVRVCAQANEAATFHLRTARGDHEIDLIVERHDRRLIGIEVKLAAAITDRDVQHLLWLRENHPRQVADLVVLYTGPHAYRRSDGVAVVPLGLLGP